MTKIFKSQRLNGYYCQGNPLLDYDLSLINEETGEKTVFREVRSRYCFASLPNFIKIEKGHRTVVEYILKKLDYKVRESKLTKRDVVVWLRVAKEAKFLPKSVGIHDLTSKKDMDNRTAIDATDLSPSLLYIYLTVIRVIQEAPAMIRMIPSLVKGYKLDFPSAWVLASKCTMNNSLHNFVNCAGGYPGSYPDINTTKEIRLSQILALKAFMRDPDKYDNSKVCKHMSWGAEQALRRIIAKYKNEVHLQATDFIDSVKRDAIKKANTPNEYLELIKTPKLKEKVHGR
jgi:hypothetical protein